MSNRSIGAAQAEALQLHKTKTKFQEHDAKLALIERKIAELEKKLAESQAMQSYLNTGPKTVNATDYELTRKKCCTTADHWKDILRGPQRQKLIKKMEELSSLFQQVTEVDDKPVLSDDGTPIPRGEDDCWLKCSLLKKRGYVCQHHVL